LAKQQAKPKSADKPIAELQEEQRKTQRREKLRKEAEQVASRENKSVAAMGKAAKAKANILTKFHGLGVNQ
jgi:hypothetical protein